MYSVNCNKGQIEQNPKLKKENMPYDMICMHLLYYYFICCSLIKEAKRIAICTKDIRYNK